ncbi:hypothetical protein [Bradyrhizobium sp. SZCCHNR3118]|uniref:hypothetical protein n=1 Tax=Bradyrhizobium sp. SZCCHNR3118 TaxID=3057468 RepID=UPI00291600C1|nr:hypothetical protein [Bradyrhizobium sp. SZCCHNR3118]
MSCEHCNGTGSVWRGWAGGDYEPCDCTRKIKLEDPNTWPQIGSIWAHRNGNQYVVMMFTNVETERQDRYPTTIVYRNFGNGKSYSRSLVDWERSMTLRYTKLEDLIG